MDDLREAFLDLAEWAAGDSPLYERLCHVIADDEDLLELAATIPADRSRSNVFLAAVHYLLLRGVDHPLAEYYPSVTEEPREPDGELGPTLRDFCESHGEELRALLATRRTQTNAVRRCAVLYPAFARIARETEGPLALIELGPSAGLNLHWDRHRYEYERDDETRVVGTRDAPVTIRSTARGDHEPPLPEEPPNVHSRVGIDLNPLDVTDREDVDWLRALIWPEQRERRGLLTGAIEIAREDPPDLIEGDLLEDLPRVLDDVPEDVPVVVYSTLVLYQVPDEVRSQLRGLIEGRATDRPLHWLAGSGILGDAGDGIRMEWTRDVDGECRTDLLAGYHQHGEWIEWAALGGKTQ